MTSKMVYKIDADGFYVEDVEIYDNEKTPPNCVLVPPNDTENGGYFFKHRWNVDHWEEGLSQEKIDAILNVPSPLSELDLIRKQQADMVFQLMMNGVL